MHTSSSGPINFLQASALLSFLHHQLFPLRPTRSLNMKNVFEAAFATASDTAEDGLLVEPSGTCDIAKSLVGTADREQEIDMIYPPILATPSTNSPVHTTADDDSPAWFRLFSQLNVSFKWQRGRLLGTGTFGSVHATTILDDPGDKQPHMAVKQLAIEEAAYHEDILNEIKIMRLLKHDNVVKLFGIDMQAGKICIFQELCGGGNLADVLAEAGKHKARIDEDAVVMYTIHLLEAIQYIHSKGVVHRDIKPENVILHTSGVAKLADFGTAKKIKVSQDSRRDLNAPISLIARDRLSKEHSFKGTPRYMSPDIVKRTNKGREGSTDIWSLGCVVRELATGEKPWSNLHDKSAILYQTGCTQEVPLPEPDQISDS